MIKILKQINFPENLIFFGDGGEFYKNDFFISVEGEKLSFKERDLQYITLRENCLLDQESVMKIMHAGGLIIDQLGYIAGDDLGVDYVNVKSSLNNYLLVTGIYEVVMNAYRLYVLQVWECAYYE